MTRKLSDYADEIAGAVKDGGSILECSHCGHAVAVINLDMHKICEFTVTCEECKKEKPLIDVPINPYPQYPPYKQWDTSPGFVWCGDPAEKFTVINNAANHNMDGGGVQGISASNPDIELEWHLLTHEPWDKYCTCGVKYDIVSEHVPGCGFLVEMKRLIEYKKAIDGYGIH